MISRLRRKGREWSEKELVGRIRESLRKEQVLETFRGHTSGSSEGTCPQVALMCLRKSRRTRRNTREGGQGGQARAQARCRAGCLTSALWTFRTRYFFVIVAGGGSESCALGLYPPDVISTSISCGNPRSLQTSPNVPWWPREEGRITPIGHGEKRWWQ